MAKLDQAYGIHAIQSLLKSAPKKIVELYLAEGRQDQRMQKVVSAAQKQGIPIKHVDKKTLDSMSDGKHQGVFAYVMPGKKLDEAALYEMVQNLDSEPLILVLDGVTDPHNLGACMRSADASGVDAVVIPKDNSASLNDVARKVACGAAETVPLIPVTNLARCLKKLQELGLWVYGAAGEAEQTIYEATLSGPRVVVMGAEGDGMRRLTRETCDELVKIPMQGSVSSLNVSVATGVVLFEVLRQRLNH